MLLSLSSLIDPLLCTTRKGKKGPFEFLSASWHWFIIRERMGGFPFLCCALLVVLRKRGMQSVSVLFRPHYHLLATPEAFGSLCVCFMCSMRASPPRNILWQRGQEVAFGPPISAACCCNRPIHCWQKSALGVVGPAEPNDASHSVWQELSCVC